MRNKLCQSNANELCYVVVSISDSLKINVMNFVTDYLRTNKLKKLIFLEVVLSSYDWTATPDKSAQGLAYS